MGVINTWRRCNICTTNYEMNILKLSTRVKYELQTLPYGPLYTISYSPSSNLSRTDYVRIDALGTVGKPYSSAACSKWCAHLKTILRDSFRFWDLHTILQAKQSQYSRKTSKIKLWDPKLHTQTCPIQHRSKDTNLWLSCMTRGSSR